MDVIRKFNGQEAFEKLFSSIIDAEIEKMIERRFDTLYNVEDTFASHDKGEPEDS